jgi:hypothetical protein
MENPSITPALSRALERLIRPMARLLLANGIPLQTAIEMLKQALVDSAVQDYSPDEKSATDSRVSLMTGVHRKDVKRLRQRQAARREAPAAISMGARLVSLWLTQAPFVGEDESPKPLPRLRSHGGETSFEALAERVSKDIRPRAVLDELLRVGAARLDDDDNVILNAEAFIPSASTEERLYYLGRALGDHMEAASRNVTGTPRPFLDRIVHYDAIPADTLDELRAAAEKAGMQALKNINRKAMEASTDGAGDAPQRITFGVYFYAEPASPGEDDNP